MPEQSLRDQQDLFSDIQLVDSEKDYFTELVGEDKKFKTPQDLARGKVESDAFIEQIKRENAELRGELGTRIKYEEFIDKLNSLPQGSIPDNQQGEPPKDVSVMSPQEIERLVEQKLSQKDQQNTVDRNIDSVKAELLKNFGPNFAQHLSRQTTELGMTQEQMYALAASSPKSVYKLLGIGEDRPRNTMFDTPPRSSIMSAPNVGKRGYSYFEDIRKKDMSSYFSPKTQNEMFSRIKEMGEEAFYNS
jgi:hypothetical protein